MSEEMESEVIDAVETEEIESEEVEQEDQEEHEESHDDSDSEEHEEAPKKRKVVFDEEQQKVFNDRIAKKVAATKAAERRAQELEARLKEYEAKIPKPEAPKVPPMPDRYDEHYEQKLADRDRAIEQAAAYKYQQAVQAQLSQHQQQEQLKAKQRELQEANTAYVQRGEKMGYKPEKLAAVTGEIIESGLGNSAQIFIRDDKSGPDICMYLSKNPDVLEEVLGMSEAMAIAHLATVVKEQAVSSARKGKTPPPPTDHLRGKGAPEGGRGPKGAIYE